MKQGIHPEYQVAKVHCACGSSFETRSTLEDIHVEICSVCHPFYTGKQKLLDTAGRVERFRKKWGDQGKKTKEKPPAEPETAEAAAEAGEPAAAAEAGEPAATAEEK